LSSGRSACGALGVENNTKHYRRRGLLPSQSTAKIAEVLRYLYDERPTMSLRAIGEQVQLHHDKVGRIRDAAAAVLGRAGLGER